MPYSTLHGEAATTFEKIYNNALKEYKDKGKAAQTAWAALKKQGYRKSDSGEWKKSSLTEFSMAITKASYDTRSGGTMRFRAVASDTEPDLYGESMTPELFQDFTDRIEHNLPIPEQFRSAICEDTWCGGLPYPSISHFKAGPGGGNVPGSLERIYVDGNRLKSEGTLSDNDLGRAVFKALLDDLYAKKSGVDNKPVRISIGFLDIQHSHVGNGMNYTFERKTLTDACPMCLQQIGGKVYQKGILVHLAFTRVPVNPRTEAEVERSMSDAVITKQDDAASIIGKELADILVDKSQAADSESVLTVKSDGTLEEKGGSVTREPQLVGRQSGEGKTLKLTDASIYQACYDPNTGLFNQECIDQAMMGHMPAMRKAMSAMWPNNRGDESDVPANDKSGKWLALFSTTKKEPDGEHPASHYLAVGDSSKPSTWHLPVKDSGGKISPRHLGAAHAALTKGFRGNKYGGPGKGKALAKLRNLYHSAGMKWPEDSDSTKEKAMATNTEKGKIIEAPVPGSPEMIDIFDEDELYPEVPSKEQSVNPTNPKGMKEPFGTVSNSVESDKAAYGGKETPEEEAAEEKKPKKPMAEKALVLSARSLIRQVMTLKAQGVYGNDALAALQPHMNQFGDAIRRSVTYSEGGDASTAAAIAALTQEIATLKAQISAQSANPQVTRSNVPGPRSIQFNAGTQTMIQQQAGGELGGLTVEKKPFNQIAQIARRSVGAG